MEFYYDKCEVKYFESIEVRTYTMNAKVLAIIEEQRDRGTLCEFKDR